MPKKSPSKHKPATKQLPDAALELIAHRFRALSEPVRLKLLSALMQGEKNVTQLVEAAGTGQANVSKHLAILKQAGMISTKREGLTTLCSISDPAIFQLCEIMCSKLKVEHEQRTKHLEGL
jgi:DNA-binding transcriptional ArsR family regulator